MQQGAGVGHPGRDDRPGDPEAAAGLVSSVGSPPHCPARLPGVRRPPPGHAAKPAYLVVFINAKTGAFIEGTAGS